LEGIQAHLFFGLAWLSFGAVHSILAGPKAKHRLGQTLGPYYRLSYNVLATVHIAAVWVFGQTVLSLEPYPLDPASATALTVLRVLGVLILITALREYDLGRFSGLAQIRAHKLGNPDPGDEPLRTGGLHRFVRHPLYLGAYLILWGGAQNDFGLGTAVWGSLYLFIGARHEERSLLALYGGAYTDYQTRVPAIIPWKGKAL